jgi:hypothetical protein
MKLLRSLAVISGVGHLFIDFAVEKLDIVRMVQMLLTHAHDSRTRMIVVMFLEEIAAHKPEVPTSPPPIIVHAPAL